MLVGGVIGEVEADRHAGSLDLGELALGEAVVAAVHQIEAADVLGGEAVYHVAHVATYAAFIGAQEDTVPGLVNGHASGAVDAQDLLAAKKLDALVLERCYNVLGLLI